MVSDYSIKGLTVNLHITNRCNLNCKYCFACYRGILDISLESWIEVLRKLKKAGVRKLNFTGGEPLLYEGLEDLLILSRKLGFQTSIVTNGSLLSDKWLEKNLKNLDIITFSLDSGDELMQHSLHRGFGDYVNQTKRKIKRVKYWSRKLNYPIYIKINVVVNRLNKDDDFSPILLDIFPNRVKFLQFCNIKGENETFSNELSISEKEFRDYVRKIKPLLEEGRISTVFESEEMMNSSYLILNPEARFCSKKNGINRFSNSLVENPLLEALKSLYSSNELISISKNMLERGGIYLFEGANKNMDFY